MHPIFRNIAGFAVYMVTCVLLGGMLAALLHFPGAGLGWKEALAVSVPLLVLFGFVCLSPWYVCRQLPLASTGALRLFLFHAGAAVVATGLWTGLARGLGQAFDLGDRINPAIAPLTAVGILLYLLSVALHYALLAAETSHRAALEARNAELRALKAQINPHFLFNSLNSVAALTTSDAGRAREMCIRLADFLRSTLGLGECESIRWRDELDLAKAYLDVEQVRFGPRLQVETDADESCATCMTPPLILQPLIENAVKHGVATMLEGGTIRLESRVCEGELRVHIVNRFDPQSPSSHRGGLGLRNVRMRLDARFGPRARLETRVEGDLFLVEMAMPCQAKEKP